MKSKINQQNKIKSHLLYAYFLAFQGLISCTLHSDQNPPTDKSSAAQIASERKALIQSLESLHAHAFELEAYMDTTRQNLENGASWDEEHQEIKDRFELLQRAFEATQQQLQTYKINLKIQTESSKNPEVQPQDSHSE